MIETGFGKSDNAKKFTELAQWVNYNGYRGMFERKKPLPARVAALDESSCLAFNGMADIRLLS